MVPRFRCTSSFGACCGGALAYHLSGAATVNYRLDTRQDYLYIQEVPKGREPTFEELLDAYLEPPADPNPEMFGITIVWVEDNDGLGALHIARKHRVTKREVEEVLFEIPPFVEAKRSRENSERTYFWGATRADRWLFIVCEDWVADGRRYLKPMTAFEPDDGEAYWRRQ